MILELFVVLIVVALVLIALGLYVKIAAFSVIGCVFLFLLGVYIILPNDLELRTGSNVIDNGAGGYNVSYVYSSYNDSTTHNVGYLLAIIGFLGVFLVPIVSPRAQEDT